MNTIWLLFAEIFVLGAVCYLLFLTSDPLERVGGRLGKLLRLPEDVIASTFQALATSGPEIMMAILAATAFIDQSWGFLEHAEKASSGTLNMAFSAMDNLLGIGAVAIIFMIRLGRVAGDEVIRPAPSTIIGLFFYVVAATTLSIFLLDQSLAYHEAWVLMIIGIIFVIAQFFSRQIINLVKRLLPTTEEGQDEDDDDDDEDDADAATPAFSGAWSLDLVKQGFLYAFLVFGLILFVKAAMRATFDMAELKIFSVGGILIMFTSYASSFPEFVMAFRYTIANKRDALLGMLFGSNVIDLAFAGFRALWTGESMEVYTTGRASNLPVFLAATFPEPVANTLSRFAASNLLIYYIWTLPVVAMLLLVAFLSKSLKWKHAYPLVVFYVIYILSGWWLL